MKPEKVGQVDQSLCPTSALQNSDLNCTKTCIHKITVHTNKSIGAIFIFVSGFKNSKPSMKDHFRA